MAVLPRVFSSGAIVATVEDVDIHLLTLESWSDRVLVRTVGAMTEPVQAVVAADMARSDEWRRRGRAGFDGAPPEPVAERLAQSLAVDLTDDSGTAFTLVARSSGGAYEGGSALYCEWVFMPAMPEPATCLTITVRTVDGHTTTQTFNAVPADGFTAPAAVLAAPADVDTGPAGREAASTDTIAASGDGVADPASAVAGPPSGEAGPAGGDRGAPPT